MEVETAAADLASGSDAVILNIQSLLSNYFQNDQRTSVISLKEDKEIWH